MRLQKVTKFVDATASQQRVVLWLECHHKVSITLLQIHAGGTGYMRDLSAATQYECPFCPDEPKPLTRDQKSAAQLYREAGEP